MYFGYGETELQYLRSRDKRMGEVIDRVGMIRREVDPDLFAAVVHHIVGQQISTKAQATVWRRMQEVLGTVDAGSVLAAGPEGLQALGISGRKAAYITDFALRVQSGTFNPETVRESSDAEAIRQLYAEHEAEVHFWKFCQYEFSLQWTALKAYAGENGIEIMGDIPIYVAADSADVWAAPELFLLDACGAPKEVAGCPPDAFSDAGQLWGNPLYDWAHHEKTGFAWWVRRIRYALNFYDILRIDHFRGFDTYYAIPYGAKTAQTGEWRSGPGMKLFRAVKQALGDVPIVAEDLGELFPSVYELLAESGFPGMKVLQFAFGPGDSEYLPHNHPVHCVVYTGTHDNTTAAAWYRTAAPAQRKKAAAYLGLNREEGFAAGLVRGALASPGELCIIPLADYLALGAEARINTPSTLGGSNWVWRALPGQLCAANAKKIAALAVLYGRA